MMMMMMMIIIIITHQCNVIIRWVAYVQFTHDRTFSTLHWYRIRGPVWAPGL